MGEMRFSAREVQERIRRITSSPPRAKTFPLGMPSIPVMVEGIRLPLRIDEFFGKSVEDKESYISKPDTIISYLVDLGDNERRGMAMDHLLNILPRFGEEEPFLEMTEVADVICRLEYGPPASVAFLAEVDEKSAENEQDKDILVKFMHIINSEPIRDSFALFAKIGKNNIQRAASQIVILSLQLKDADAIRRIGETIIELNDNFGIHTTYYYRIAVFDIVTKREISVESRVKLVDELSGKITTFENDTEVVEFAQMVERAFLVEKEPEAKILELCKKK